MSKFRNRAEYEAWKKERLNAAHISNEPVYSLSCKAYRYKGEKAALCFGIAVLIFMFLLLSFSIFVAVQQKHPYVEDITIATTVISLIAVKYVLPLFLVGCILAIVVWIKQGQLIGTCAKITKSQFPEIFDIAETTARNLNMKLPDIFIRQDPTINAYAIGLFRKKSVVLHSSTVEAMSIKELVYILGHEFSHIKCGHTRLIVLTDPASAIKIPFLSQFLRFIFLFWMRNSEYTCDRGGLIAGRDLTSSITAICKLAVGPKLFEKMNIDDFLNQQFDLKKDNIARFSETISTHPFLFKRIMHIKKFYESDQYSMLIDPQKYKGTIKESTIARLKGTILSRKFIVPALSLIVITLLVIGMNSYFESNDNAILDTYWRKLSYDEVFDQHVSTSYASMLQDCHELGIELCRFWEWIICRELASKLNLDPSQRCDDRTSFSIQYDKMDLVDNFYCFDNEAAIKNGFSVRRIAKYLVQTHGIDISDIDLYNYAIEKYKCRYIKPLTP